MRVKVLALALVVVAVPSLVLANGGAYFTPNPWGMIFPCGLFQDWFGNWWFFFPCG